MYEQVEKPKESNGRIVTRSVARKKSEINVENGVIQQHRGKTNYGAMTGTNLQGPHTIAHSTIAAVEETTELYGADRYNEYKKQEIILTLEDLKDKNNKDRPDATDGTLTWLNDRYDVYEAEYKEALELCEYWETEYNNAMDEEDKIDAEEELNKAVTDIRDMHPASTYAGDIEEGATLVQMYGKGEQTSKKIKEQMAGVTVDDYDGLYAVIMADADTGDLEDDTEIKDLAWHYVDLAITGMSSWTAR